MSKKTNTMSQTCFLINDQEQVTASEAFKSIRTNLLSILSSYEEQTKVISFTSPEAGNGSTLTCVNIAVSFAKMGAKVLLIDTDMRHPQINNFFNIPVTPGLSDALTGKCTEQDATVLCSDIPGLSLISAGTLPHNPTELILSAEFNAMLANLRNKYDYVFIDTPPVCSFTDAAIISQKTLGAILVCRSAHTKIDIAKKAKHILEQGGGKILGTILNGVSAK